MDHLHFIRLYSAESSKEFVYISISKFNQAIHENAFIFISYLVSTGICISWPPALCFVSGSDPRPRPLPPNLYLSALAPNLYLLVMPHNLYLLVLAPQFVFTGSDPQFVFTTNFYYPAQSGLSLHIPTLSPQFVFTSPGLWFVRTQAAKLIYP